MTLREMQQAFRSEIASGDDAGAPSSTGMAIYRDAYRGRLLAALGFSFERTRAFVGDDAFEAAACHYILANPSRSWTIDDYGAGFPAVLDELFAEDPAVADLAWHEWLSQRAFTAPDRSELDPATLAAAGLGPQDWDRVTFSMAAGFAMREVHHDCTADPLRLAGPKVLLVWRHHLRTCTRLADADEAGILQRIAEGHSLGEAVLLGDAASPERLASWLALWLSEGLFSGYALGET